MEVKYLQISNESKANEIAAKVKDLTGLLASMETIDENPVSIPGVPGFFVTTISSLDTSEYSSEIISTVDQRPDLKVFAEGLQENYEREEDGRDLVKQLVTMLDSGLGGVPQSVIAALFKDMGWVRSMLKEGFFETAFYEFTVVFSPANQMLTAEQKLAIQEKILILAKKYNSSFDGSVS